MRNLMPRLLTYHGIPLRRDARVLQTAAQVISVIVVVSVLAFILANLLRAADRRGLSLGFSFPGQEAGFPISESVVRYEESDSFLYAFWVVILNTLKVAVLGAILATVLGTTISLARLSSNLLVRKIAGLYVETFRNILVLVQLFYWYFVVFQALPLVKESLRLP